MKNIKNIKYLNTTKKKKKNEIRVNENEIK